ncbi:hypothetical protein A3715_17495 [Oleiphilus sp. HI0009]|nr:hypothetical protein A3715_17495 [Oleiphilus sp. HI0009]
MIHCREDVYVIQTDRFDASEHKKSVHHHMKDCSFDYQYGVLPCSKNLDVVFARSFPPPSLCNTNFSLIENNEFSFFIRLNPAIHRTHKLFPNKRKDRVYPITDVHLMNEWLINKLYEVSLDVKHSEVIFHRVTPRQEGLIAINDVWFFVKAVVLNEFDAIDAFNAGIGRHKSYGFGMFIPEGSVLFDVLHSIKNN